MAVDFKKLDSLDKVVVVTAAVALIALFLPWFGWSGVYGGSWSGFNAGFSGWFGDLLVVAAGVYLLLLRSGSRMPAWKYGPGVLVLGASAIGAILMIYRWATIPHAGNAYGGFGPRIGLYLALIAGIVQAFISFKLFKASGEKLPWDEKKSEA